MIKTVTTANNSYIHVTTGQPEYGDPEAICVMVEVTNPVELTVEDAQQLIQNLSDVINATQA